MCVCVPPHCVSLRWYQLRAHLMMMSTTRAPSPSRNFLFQTTLSFRRYYTFFRQYSSNTAPCATTFSRRSTKTSVFLRVPLSLGTPLTHTVGVYMGIYMTIYIVIYILNCNTDNLHTDLHDDFIGIYIEVYAVIYISLLSFEVGGRPWSSGSHEYLVSHRGIHMPLGRVQGTVWNTDCHPLLHLYNACRGKSADTLKIHLFATNERDCYI